MQRKRPRSEAGGAPRGRGAAPRGGRGRGSAGRGLNEVVSLAAGDSDEEDLGEQTRAAAAAPEPTLEDIETADEKRLRLARAYLGTLARQAGGGEGEEEEEEDEEEDEDAARGVIRPRPSSSAIRDAISQRLHQDAQLISGGYFRPVAGLLATALPLAEGFAFTKAHSLPVTCIAVAGDGRSAVSGSKDCCLLRWLVPEAAGPLEKVGKCPGRLRTRADVQRQLEQSSRKQGQGVLSVKGGTFGGGRLGPLASSGGSAGGGAAADAAAPKIFRNVAGVSTIIAHLPSSQGGSSGKESLGTALRTVPDYGIGGHWGEVLAVAISSDGAFIASGGKDKMVRIWDGKHELAQAKGSSGSSSSSSSSGSGSGSSGSGRASAPLPLVPNLENLVGHKEGVTGLAFQPGTHTLFSAGADRLVKQWGLDDMAHADTLFGHQAEIAGLDVPGASRGGKVRAITAGADRTARLWKVSEGTQLVFRAAPTCGGLECVRAVTDSLYVTGAASGAISLWSSARKRPIFTLHCAHGTGLGVPVAGAHASAEETARAAAVEGAAGGGEEEGGSSAGGGLAQPGAYPSLAATGDGAGPPPALLAAIAAVTGCGEGGLSGGYCAQVTALALMPQADVLASGSGDGFVRLWRLVAGEGGGEGGGAAFRGLAPLGAIPCKGIVNGLAFSADGRALLAAVGTEHRLGRWWKYSQAQNGVAVLRLPGLVEK